MFSLNELLHMPSLIMSQLAWYQMGEMDLNHSKHKEFYIIKWLET